MLVAENKTNKRASVKLRFRNGDHERISSEKLIGTAMRRINTIFLESLILAQDERWRRA